MELAHNSSFEASSSCRIQRVARPMLGLPCQVPAITRFKSQSHRLCVDLFRAPTNFTGPHRGGGAGTLWLSDLCAYATQPSRCAHETTQPSCCLIHVSLDRIVLSEQRIKVPITIDKRTPELGRGVCIFNAPYAPRSPLNQSPAQVVA
jgi:hypothetical protein